MARKGTTPYAVNEIARRFAERFPAESVGWRTVGREAEYPLVHPDGQLANVAELWGTLREPGDLEVQREATGLIVALGGDVASYALEVGRGTVEVITGPCEDLFALKSAHEGAMARLVGAAEAAGIWILGYGIQPVAGAELGLMSPKVRYGVLLEAIGAPWLSFARTASDQVHTDISQDELVAATNLCNLLAPVTIALCAHSSVVEGAAAEVCSAREHSLGTIEAVGNRHGMPGAPARNVKDHVARLCALNHLMARRNGAYVQGEGKFLDFLRAHPGADPEDVFDAFLFHEHYVWHSARPRSAHATVELRAACQQPPGDHMAATALGFAMVCAHVELQSWMSERLGRKAWNVMRRWHAEVIREGLSVPEPEDGLIAGVLARCTAALEARGRGEEALLTPLYDRLERGTNPAQDLRTIFADGGLPAVLEAVRWRP